MNDSLRVPAVHQPRARHRTLSMVPVTSLVPDPANPRIHTDKHVQQIAASMLEFHFTAPILVDIDNRVIAGHGRLLAAQSLGWNEVPVIRLDDLTPQQAAAYKICDNRLSEISEWNPELLGRELKALSELDLDFDLGIVGFDLPQIDALIQGLDAPSIDEADLLPPQDSGPIVSVLGDLWHLGSHRLQCGNALEADDIAHLMDGQQAAMVFADPPYNCKIAGHVSGKGKIKHAEFAMASGELSKSQFTEFLSNALAQVRRVCRPGALLYVCQDWRNLDAILSAMAAQDLELKNLVCWDKGTGGMGSMYRSQHELIFLMKAGDAPHINNIRLGRYGRNRTNVWSYPGMGSFARNTSEGNLLECHPTVKPVALIADAIRDASHRRDVVLDTFAGSGSTLIAAEQTGRFGYGLELDPKYVDTAVRRWQRLTKRHAVHAHTGATFDEVAELRAPSIAPIAQPEGGAV